MSQGCGCYYEEIIAFHKDGIVLMNDSICQVILNAATMDRCGQPLISHRKKPIDVYKDVVVDSRLKSFDPDIGSAGSSKSVKSLVKKNFENKCAFCGSTTELTVAHIVADNTTSSTSFGPPVYKDTADLKGTKNRLLLCGSKTTRGSCHNRFNYHTVTIIYDAFRKRYFLKRLDNDPADPNTSKYDTDGKIELTAINTLPDDQKPYKRLIAWRMRAAAMKHASSLTEKERVELVLCADLSESGELVGANSTATLTSRQGSQSQLSQMDDQEMEDLEIVQES